MRVEIIAIVRFLFGWLAGLLDRPGNFHIPLTVIDVFLVFFVP